MQTILYCATAIIAFASSSGAENLVLEKGAEVPLEEVKLFSFEAVAANELDVSKEDIARAESITFPNGETLTR